MALVKNRKKVANRAGLQPAFRLWFEGDKREIILDQTDAMLLRHISERNSLTEAAKAVGISYRNAWDRVNTLQKNLGKDIVETKVGGRKGGGASLTDSGVVLLKEFRRLRKYLFDALEDKDFWEHISYKLSARNRIRAKVIDIQRGTITSEIKMRVRLPASLTSIISNEAVEDLELRENDEVEAIIKATEVIIAKKKKEED